MAHATSHLRIAHEVASPEELAAEAQAGSLEAFSELVRLLEGRVYNFLLRRLPAHDAEDLTQETFIRAWQRLHQYQSKWRFSTWLFTIATRLAATHVRSGRPATGLEAATGTGRPAEPGLGLMHGEMRGRIWGVVDETLTAEQRMAVWLRYVEDLSMQDIALVMGKSQVGVRVMLHRARGILAERLLEGGIAEQVEIKVLKGRQRQTMDGGAR